MAIETTPLGFQKPDGGEAVRNGDNVIAANAQKSEDRHQEERGRLNQIEEKNLKQDKEIAGVGAAAIQAAKDYTDSLALVPAWKPDTVYAAGKRVIAPTGDYVSRISSGTSAATWAADKAAWNPSTQDTRLMGVESKNVNQDNRLDAHDNNIQALDGWNQAQDNRLGAVESKNTAQDGRLDAAETKATEMDTRTPTRSAFAGLSFAAMDKRGARTRLEANDTDGGPTPHSLSLDGPALKTYMDFVTGTDTRVPKVDTVPGASLAAVDGKGRALWIQANDTDGGPTPYAVQKLREHMDFVPQVASVPGTSYAVVDAKGKPMWIQANSTDGGPTPYTVQVLRDALGGVTASSTYIADGDSITEGTHGGGTPATWPDHLATLLGKPVVNRGRSGTTAVEAAMRQGGLTPVLTVTGGVLPADTATAVPVQRIHPANTAGAYTGGATHGARTYAGTFDGIPAELKENTDDTWTLRRTVAGTEYKTTDRTPFIIDGLDPKATRIFWPGRNDNPKTNALANIDHMAKWTTDNGGRFLVLSILTKSGIGETDADNTEIRAVNEAIQAKYPRNFVNIRDWLVKYGVEAAGLTPTQADTDATAVGGIPPSLMADSLHPNASGRLAIAKYIHQQLIARNWA